jgi:Helix-turn-helix domain
MVRGRKTNLVIYLTPEERRDLEAWQRSDDVRAGLSRRGQIILMLTEGASITQISRTVGICRRFIYKWAQRFRDEGITGLTDRPGRGRVAHDHNSSASPLLVNAGARQS